MQARDALANSHTLEDLDEHMKGLTFDGNVRENQRRSHQPHRGKRRKYKIVIHTSPFQRCVQTSIAISAGIAQYQGPASPTSHQTHPRPHIMHSGSPHIRAMDRWNSPYLSAIAEPEDYGRSRPKRLIQRTLLRVDAFLGEWLSPEYFDRITPPPASKMMVASSKAYLLYQGDSVNLTHTSNRTSTGQGNFPGGWHGGSTAGSKSLHSDDDTALAELSNNTRPRIGRASSHSLGSSPKRSDLISNTGAERSQSPESSAYVPPVPSYAISPSQPIPSGYVSHARDACVKVDNLWDSLRPPLEWGSGGEYGEEWSAMHKRFRKGLQEMISWYRSHDDSETLKPIRDESSECRNSSSEDLEDSDDNDTDTVLILVTHGAGCNALIGALTSQPVLLDVGMASLTMAVRKSVAYKRVSSPQSENVPASPSRRRRSLIDPGISEDYEVKLTASTEHLRAGSPFLAPPQAQRTPSLPIREKSPYRYERPGFLNSHDSKYSPTKKDFNVDSQADGTFGGLQRSATSVIQSSGGLWSMPVPKQVDNAVEQDNKHPVKARNVNGVSERVGIDLHAGLNGSSDSGQSSPTANLDHANQGHSIAPNGLWGAPPQALGTIDQCSNLDEVVCRTFRP